MVIFGRFNMGEVPFKDVFIHPVIQDGAGKRMSKTAGNGIDPVDIIEQYGADALRFTLAGAATETQDLRIPVDWLKDAEGRFASRRGYGQPIEWLSPEEAKLLPKDRRVNTSERFEQGRNFSNKFWNAARFSLMNLEGYEPAPASWDELPAEDRWILSGLAQVEASTRLGLDAFRFAEVARDLRDFTWNRFCDWYVEFLKGRLRDPAARPLAQCVLAAVLDGLCRLLHPIMPFVTEQVWQALGQVAPFRGIAEPKQAEESVCIAAWPSYDFPRSVAEDEAVRQWQEKITALRNLRAERDVPKSARIAPDHRRGRAGRLDVARRRGVPAGPGRRLDDRDRPARRTPREQRRHRAGRRGGDPPAGGPDRPGGRGGPQPQGVGGPRQAVGRRPGEARQRVVPRQGPGRTRRPAARQARRVGRRSGRRSSPCWGPEASRPTGRRVDGPGRSPYHRTAVASRTPARSPVSDSCGPGGTTIVPVQMELVRIVISENGDQQIIFLKELDGERTFPIVIGPFEAHSIDRRVRGQVATRPLTHDLLASTIEQLGGDLQDIFISELRDQTYFAKLRIRHDGETIEVDSRPSDAIALAVTVEVPIYVAEEVLDEVG